MAKHVCAEPGCPNLIDRGVRCPTCTRTRDRARGTRQQRGYDAAYDAEHLAWQRRLDTGEPIQCWRCTELGRPHLVDPRPGRWHLGHDPADRSIIRGPQCPQSNLADAGGSSP